MSNLSEHEREQAEITEEWEADNATGLTCPDCGQIEAFFIVATVQGRYTAEGFDPDHPDVPDASPEWGKNSICTCTHCSYTAKIKDFAP